MNEHKELVAIKVAKRQDDNQFTTELENLKNFGQHEHPNVIKKLDENTKGPKKFIVYQLAKGDLYAETFKRLKEGLPIEISQIKSDVQGVLSGLEFIELNGLSHWDIKPGNLLRGYDNEIIIGDFGLSTSFDASYEFKGTWSYLAPEIMQHKSDVDGRKADIFSLGKTILEIVTARSPFDKASADDKFYNLLIKKKYKEFWAHFTREENKEKMLQGSNELVMDPNF